MRTRATRRHTRGHGARFGRGRAPPRPPRVPGRRAAARDDEPSDADDARKAAPARGWRWAPRACCDSTLTMLRVRRRGGTNAEDADAGLTRVGDGVLLLSRMNVGHGYAPSMWKSGDHNDDAVFSRDHRWPRAPGSCAATRNRARRSTQWWGAVRHNIYHRCRSASPVASRASRPSRSIHTGPRRSCRRCGRAPSNRWSSTAPRLYRTRRPVADAGCPASMPIVVSRARPPSNQPVR